jgi:hypothetical protein
MAYESFGSHALENVYDDCGGIESFEKLNEMQLECYEEAVKKPKMTKARLPQKKTIFLQKKNTGWYK